MGPKKPLPYSEAFSSVDEYVDALVQFTSTSELFQLLAGGVHILDFFTTDPGLFYHVIPEDWRHFILSCETMEFLDFLLRDNLDDGEALSQHVAGPPPDTLLQYVRTCRRLLLDRTFTPPPGPRKLDIIPRSVAVGMKTKKKHEVTHFADYVDRLCDEINAGRTEERKLTHLVDFGSGQNYLGRTLASPPYSRHVVAVEGRRHNILASKGLDVMAGLGTRQKVVRNKKRWMAILDSQKPEEYLSEKAKARLKRRQAGSQADKQSATTPPDEESAEVSQVEQQLGPEWQPEEQPDGEPQPEKRLLKERQAEQTPPPEPDFRPIKMLSIDYTPQEGKGHVHYVEGKLDSGDLSDVIATVASTQASWGEQDPDKINQENLHDLSMMAVSIHSCGNLSHHGIRSLVLNPSVQAVAIVGCCYNLVTEKLGPPTVKPPFARRPTLQPLNGKAIENLERGDPHGFPMSERLTSLEGRGARLNITARMMACQAPENWTEEESAEFFNRHYYRAVLQRMFLDRGVVKKVYHHGGDDDSNSLHPAAPEETKKVASTVIATAADDPLQMSTNPVIIGSLRKPCYASLQAYVRGAVTKLTTSADYAAYADAVRQKMAPITDAEIDAYEAAYLHRRRELAAVWSLMALSGCVVEALMVTDRWLFLREQVDVADTWVESVFAYKESPRNLVVVGVKK